MKQLNPLRFFGFSKSKESCWQRRTNLEKQLLIIFFISSLITIFLLTFIISIYFKYIATFLFIKPLEKILNKVNLDKIELKINNNENFCFNPDCINIAAQMINNMKKNINPCDDFYEFTCGNWINKHSYNHEESYSSNFDQLNNDASKKIERLLQKVLPNEKNKIFKNLHSFLGICNKIDHQNTDEIELKNFINSKLGGWPIAENDLDIKFDLIDFHKALDDHGYTIDGLIKTEIVLDYFNTSQYTTLISAPSAGFFNNYLFQNFSNKKIQDYFNLVKETISDYNPEKNIDEEAIWQMILFEKNLLALIDSSENGKEPNKSILYKGEIDNLIKLSPLFPWKKFLEIFYKKPILKNQNIIYTNMNYLETFYGFINQTDETVLKNYLIWRIIRVSIEMMNNRWSSIMNKFYEKNFGYTNLKNQKQFCNNLIYTSFYHLIDHLYLKEKPNLEKKEKVLEIAKSIQKQFIKNLQSTKWIDENARLKTISKAKNMIFKIGYPEELLNETKVFNYYSNLKLKANLSFYENIMIINRWSKNSKLELLTNTNAKTDWKSFGPIFMVNAFYSRSRNLVILPIGILNRHIYNKNNPFYINYAALGYIISHEMTHGFDEDGIKIDENGHLEVWKKESKTYFKKKVNCIIQKYLNYSIINDKKRSEETVNENIADINGVKQSFYAYKNYLKEKKIINEKYLPGLQEFDNEQMFWIFYANTWCRKNFEKQSMFNGEIENHSLAKYRVIGVLSNSQEFANSFKCAVGTKMNPKKQKCTIW